jgi:uncharacterized protein YcnI
MTRWIVYSLLLGWTAAAFAHVDVVPRQSLAKRWETYTLRVPTETAAATVKLQVTVPAAFEIEMVGHRQDWQIDTVRDERGFVREMTWSGGRVPTQTFDEFKFMARNPASPQLYHWEMTQVYETGEAAKWTAQTQILAPHDTGSQQAAEAWRAAQVATTLSLLAMGIATTLIVVMLMGIVPRRPPRRLDRSPKQVAD